MLYLVDLKSKIVVHQSEDESELEDMRPRYKVLSPSALLAVCEGPSPDDVVSRDEYEERARVAAIDAQLRTQNINAATVLAEQAETEARKAREHVERLRQAITPITK